MERKSLVQNLIHRCMACGPVDTTTNQDKSFFFHKSIGPATQFVELTGIRFIGLGAMADELTARERVYDTLEVFRTDPNRLLRVGYIHTEANNSSSTNTTTTDDIVSSVPVAVWERECTDDDSSMSVAVQTTIQLVRNKAFAALVDELSRQYRKCQAHMTLGINFYRAGILAHNLGVAKVLAGQEGAANMFVEAISLKEAAFGKNHDEIALSWEQLGIQQFATGDFPSARTSFQTAHRCLLYTSPSPRDLSTSRMPSSA